MLGGAPGGSNISQASTNSNSAEPWGHSDGRMDLEMVVLLTWAEGQGSTGTAGRGGKGASGLGAPAVDLSSPSGAGRGRLAQRPAEKEVLVVEVWKQLLCVSRVRL